MSPWPSLCVRMENRIHRRFKNVVNLEELCPIYMFVHPTKQDHIEHLVFGKAFIPAAVARPTSDIPSLSEIEPAMTSAINQNMCLNGIYHSLD